MRKVFSVGLLAAMLCMVGITKDAGATVTVSLVWGAANGGITFLGDTALCPVGTCAGSTLRLDIFMSTDLTQGLKIHTFSMNFDTALDNELNLGPMVAVEWGGTDINPGPPAQLYTPITVGIPSGSVESTGAIAGRINGFESGSLVGILPRNLAAYSVGTYTATSPANYRVGQVFFTTNGATLDGADVFMGLFNGVFDDIFDGDGNVIAPANIVFGTATLNAIPEPGTVSLLGLGLVGLVLAGRRSRRS